MSKLTLSVAIGIIARDNQFLLAIRPLHVLSPGLWEFPGGKIEKDETPYRALQRELKEEIGIVVNSATLLHVFEYETENKILALHAFTVESYDGVPSSCEGQVVEWRPKSDLLLLNFPPANMPLLKLLSSSHG